MTPRTHYQQIQRATTHLAIITILLLGMTLICAWLGFTQSVMSLRGATASAAYAFAVLFMVWGIASLFRVVRPSHGMKLIPVILSAIVLCGCEKNEDAATAESRKQRQSESAKLQRKIGTVRAEIAAISNRMREMQPGGALEIESNNLSRAESEMVELQATLVKSRL
jgi:hypothetical protein